MNYQLKIRATLAALDIGTIGFDIRSVASFFGIPGGRSWERAFNCHSQTVQYSIGIVANDIIKKAILGEIIGTIID